MKTLKKILKWTGVVLGGLVAIALVANAVFVWTTDARLERQLAAIRAAGDPLSLADLARKPIPAERNAATYLRRAKAGIDAIDKEVWTAPRFVECFETKGPAPTGTQKAIKAVFSAYPDVIPLLRQAAACPEYDAQLDYTLPPEKFVADKMIPLVQEMRAAVNVLRYRVWLLRAEGSYDEAMRTALVALRLARHLEREPTLISYLVALACQCITVQSANLVLQTGPISKEVREALDSELARQERMEGYTWAVKSERAYVLDEFRNIVPCRSFLLFRGYWNRQESECLDAFRALIALASDSGPYRQTDRAIGRTIRQIGRGMVLARLLMSGSESTNHLVARTRAQLRALRVLNALQTHVPAGSSKAPKLTDLGLPAETIADPFTGEPLHVKKTPRGWIVYSVGPNFQDDGGKIDNPVTGDIGVGPPPVAKPGKSKAAK